MNDEIRNALETVAVLEQPLGAGAFAEVWRVKYKGVPRALRVCLHRLDDSEKGRFVQQERETLRRIVMIPELLNRIGFIEEVPLPVVRDETTSHYYVTVWQLATANLLAWWRGAVSADRDARLLGYLRQVANAIDLLNDYGFHHRDIKPENILLEGDAAWLCDLGLSKQVGLSTYRGTFVGTEKYWPPEMQQHGESHPTNDLYCLAASFLRLKARLAPPQFLEMHAREQSPPELLRSEAAVVAEALAPDPNQRPTDGAVAWVRRLEQAALTEAVRHVPSSPAGATPHAETGSRANPPHTEMQDPQATTDRMAVLHLLEEIYPTDLLDRIALQLNIPRRDRPPDTLAHGARCRAVLEWVEARNCMPQLETALAALTPRR